LKAKIHEYEALGQNLLQISQKSTQEVMVPLSEVGFFTKGKIKHSNEFLVFLGDGYFVQRTAHECQPIIQRRIDSKYQKPNLDHDRTSETARWALGLCNEGRRS
jgi:prefoldin subunit 5